MTGGIVLALGATGKNLGSGMTGGLLYMPADCLQHDQLNLDFVRAEECSTEEEINLQLVLRKHWELTGSPRAAMLLDARDRAAFIRLQPVKLPCPVDETWAPILRRFQNRSQAIPAPAFANATLLASEEESTQHSSAGQ